MNYFKYAFSITIFFSLSASYSQQTFISSLFAIEQDTTYIRRDSNVIVGRIYTGHKYTRFNVITKNVFDIYRYRPQTNFTMGIGATYKDITLNVAIPVPEAINPFEHKVETKFLDLQTSIYTSKVNLDFFAEFYQGMYLQETNTYESEVTNQYYTRPDISTIALGLSVYYIFNHTRFSYKAPNIQSEEQLKSSGSVLLGVDINYGVAKGDSAFIPTYANTDTSISTKKMSYIHIGPGIGYAYNLILLKHFFWMTSITTSIGLGNDTELDESNNKTSHLTASPAVVFKTALGFNSRKWFIGAVYLNNSIININKKGTFSNVFAMGRIRFMVARRFGISTKTKKKLDSVIPKF